MTKNNLQNKPYPLGAHIEEGGVRFSLVSKAAACGVLLYDRATGRQLMKLPFTAEERIGNIHCKLVRDLDAARIAYLFYEGDCLIPDERARVFIGKATYGKERTPEDLRAGFPTGEFDWGQDQCPRVPYRSMVGYCMHVRGFTRHTSSGVRNRGTFDGILEKIPYLKEIGVTTIELQPAYEFAEVPTKEERLNRLPTSAMPGELDTAGQNKLNYWGYKKGYYYTPKAAYAATKDPVTEFKALVKALHENRMELVMQFYFPHEVKRSEISEILRFWVLEYHVDGFHLLGDNLFADQLAKDDMLADTKIWYYHFDVDSIYGREEQPLFPHVAEYNDAWYYCMRGYLKGDGNTLGNVLYQMRHLPEKAGRIHYLTNYYGFTLADLVSYDHKHNEANGEDNRDGNDYNCSWNCGEEGVTRRQKVKKLREKQMKNALSMLMLSQSAPLIFMGDEFGNSQRGNNNPYCQDNAVTWLDWSGIEKNQTVFSFWKMLVDFRKKHPILRTEREMRLMDYISCGYPDLSYHGQNAWRAQTEGNCRHIGIMLCGKYAWSDQMREDDFLYLAFNMHWESHELALPKLPKGMRWEMVFSTETQNVEAQAGMDGKSKELSRKIPPRSIAVYISSVTGNADGEEEAVKREIAKGRKTVSSKRDMSQKLEKGGGRKAGMES